MFNGALRRLFKGDVYNAWGDALLFAGKRADARQQYANALNAGPWDGLRSYAHRTQLDR